MKKSKRILALVLVLALAFTSFAMLASASEADVEERRYDCPVCRTVLRRYTEYKIVSQTYTTCDYNPNLHLHVTREEYYIVDCPSCDYVDSSTLVRRVVTCQG